MTSGLKSGAQLKIYLKERVHLVLFITSRSYSCFQLLRLFFLISYNKNKVLSDFRVMRGSGVPRMQPLTGPWTTRCLYESYLDNTDNEGTQISSVIGLGSMGRRRTSSAHALRPW